MKFKKIKKNQNFSKRIQKEFKKIQKIQKSSKK